MEEAFRTRQVANKRDVKIGFERIGAIVPVLVLLFMATVVVSTMMSTARTAADPNSPAGDVRTTAIRDAKTLPPT